MYSFKRNKVGWSITQNTSTILDTADMRLNESNDIISPKTAKPSNPVTLNKRIDTIAYFKEYITDKDERNKKVSIVPVYNSRACYFFMTKMAVDENENYTLCKTGRQCCPTRTNHFYVMPKYTTWVQPGDLGLVVNLKSPQQEAAYAICADLGPDETKIEGNETVYFGKLGECSIALGKYLKIDGSGNGDGSKAFQYDGILYFVFPNTGITIYESDKIYTLREINEKAHIALQHMGGWKHVKDVVKEKYNIELK